MCSNISFQDLTVVQERINKMRNDKQRTRKSDKSKDKSTIKSNIKRKEYSDYVFTLNQPHSADDFAKGLKALAEHCRIELDQGQLIHQELVTGTKTAIQRPEKTKRKDAAGKDIEWDDVDEMILKEEVREYGTKKRQLEQSRGKTFGKMRPCAPMHS